MNKDKFRKQPVDKEVLFLFRLNKSGEVVSIKNTVSVAAGKNYTRNFFRAFAKAEHFVRKSYFTQDISRVGYIACDKLYPDLKDILPVIERANRPFWCGNLDDMTPLGMEELHKQLMENNPGVLGVSDDEAKDILANWDEYAKTRRKQLGYSE